MFALIHWIGQKAHRWSTKATLFWVCVTILTAPAEALELNPNIPIKIPQLIQFNAFRGEKLSHTTQITISKTQKGDISLTQILTSVSAPDILEYNECILDPNYNLYSIKQISKNQRDNAFFKWTIYVKKQKADISYTQLKTHEEQNLVSKLPEKTYPIQALLFLMQYLDLSKNDQRFELIVPPATTYPMIGRIIDEEEITWKGQSISTYVLEFKYAGLFAFMLPKALFWVKKEAPHIPIQYEDQNYRYQLVK